MSTPAAAQAETAAPTTSTPAAGLPDSASAAASTFAAKLEAKGKEPPPKVEVKPDVERIEKPKAKPRIDPNLVKREREAGEKLKRAEEIEAKLQPLQDALKKRDLRGAMKIMAHQHGVTFADFVDLLKTSGDEDETVEAKAERIARETIEKAKAKDAETEAAAAKERETAAQAEHAAKVKAFADKLQTQAEGDPERWKHAAVNGSGAKAVDVIFAFHEATGGRLETAEALDVVEESWDLVKAHLAQTKQRLDIDKAIQLVVGELAKLGADGARAKLREARNPSATGKARNEAGEQTNGGRAAEPRINNRTTSGGNGVVPARDPDAPVTFGKSAVDEAIRRAGLSARVQ